MAPATKKAPARKQPAKKVVAVAKDAAPVEEPAAPAPTPAPAPTREGFRWRPLTIVFIVVAILAGLTLAKLGKQERGDPAHTFASVKDVPATLYLPEKVHDDRFPNPKPVGQRPPLVVVAHGFSADQQTMSTISRSLANHGFAVLAIDFRGHGSNTHAFEGDIIDDLKASLDWADTSPYVDHDRYAVLGHSMGASAALEFASRDPRVKAVIPLSGGDIVDDDRVPPNVLLISAQNDPSQIRDRQQELETELGGKTNVKRVVVSGKNHGTILWSNTAIKEMTGWLDNAFGTQGPTGTQDNRLGTVGFYFLMALVLLFGIGLATGRLTPAVEGTHDAPWTSGGAGLLLMAGALLVVMPLLALGSPTGFLNALVGNEQVGYLGLAGALLFVGRALAKRSEWQGPIARRLTGGDRWTPENWRSTALAGVLGAVAVFVVIQPMSVVFHRLVPTPERLVLLVVSALILLPINLAAEALIRRGSYWVGVGWGAAARVMAVVMLFIGIGFGVLPGVLALVANFLVLFYALIEVFAAGVYRRSGNVATIAIAESLLMAWLIAVASPML